MSGLIPALGAGVLMLGVGGAMLAAGAPLWAVWVIALGVGVLVGWFAGSLS